MKKREIFEQMYYFNLEYSSIVPYVQQEINSRNMIKDNLESYQAIQNQRNSFSRGFPLLFNVETLQAFVALFQIPHYYRKFLYLNQKCYAYSLS
jgi:hypothetical protein